MGRFGLNLAKFRPESVELEPMSARFGPSSAKIAVGLFLESRVGVAKYRVRCRLAQGSSAAEAHHRQPKESGIGPDEGAQLAKESCALPPLARSTSVATVVGGSGSTRASNGGDPPRSQTEALVGSRSQPRPSREEDRSRPDRGWASSGIETWMGAGPQWAGHPICLYPLSCDPHPLFLAPHAGPDPRQRRRRQQRQPRPA